MHKLKQVPLTFMVDPAELAQWGYVPDAVRVRFVNPEKVYALGLLGESGRKLVEAGIAFYFERKQAEWMIEQGIAERADS